MSKSTAAVILTSAARLAPWGDDGWRFSGAMQLVADGPDWLHAAWTRPGGAEKDGSETDAKRFATLVLRDAPADRAEDIAVMSFALLQVPEWTSLQGWWDEELGRRALRPLLREIAETYTGQFKLAVVDTDASGVAPDVIGALRTLGFEVVRFSETS